jgi:hypothetical protein
VHHLDIYCRCGKLLCVAGDIHRINRNSVWTRAVSNTHKGKEGWNPYKKELYIKVHCTHCNLIVGHSYPDKRLFKLFYVDIKGEPQLYCRPTTPFASVTEAVAQHQPLDPNDRLPFPRQGAPVKRDLERQQARELGFPEEDDHVMRALTAQIRDATVRDAICTKQQAEKAREENRRLQEENRKLEQQVRRVVSPS